MLFSYNKEKGLFNVGGTDLFTNKNQNILNSGNNKNFLDVIQNDWNSSNFDANSIQARADALGDVNKEFVVYCQEAKAAGVASTDLQKNWIAQGSAVGKFKGALKSLGDVGATALATLGNAFVSMGISLAITGAIKLVSSFVDWLVITKNEAAEMANTFSDSFSGMQKTQGENIKTISSLEEEFDKLSKGVNALGQNVSLSDEEFERYHEITSTIADKIPSLVSGYDEQGNAIIRLTDNVKSLSAAYRDEMQAEAAAQYAMKA